MALIAKPSARMRPRIREGRQPIDARTPNSNIRSLTAMSIVFAIASTAVTRTMPETVDAMACIRRKNRRLPANSLVVVTAKLSATVAS